jgi:short-subunit dehydrogenase
MLSLLLLAWIILNVYTFIFKYFLIKELDLAERYGKNTWVLITGSSAGQGKQFAVEFAKRGFNILLSGYKEILDVKNKINVKYPNIQVKTIITDFSHAYKKNYFKIFEKTINELPGELSILVNNVGYRVGWKNYHEMPEKMINDSIVVGTIVQSRMTQIAIQKFINRTHRSAIINITTQCMYPVLYPGKLGYITIPYTSVYDASNAFGFFHSNSIEKEYGEQFDVLNITPGSVTTENTEYMSYLPFSINCKLFVRNILSMLGQIQGPTCAYWGHEFSSILMNLTFGFSDLILRNAGLAIAENTKKYSSLSKA